MTDIATPRSPAEGRHETAQAAKEQARNVGQSAAQAGGDVLHSATGQGRQVVGEARRQAHDLYGEARGELRQQAGAQQRRAAGGLRAVGDEIRTMAQQGGGSGPATELARQASDKIGRVADWLDDREPGQLLDEVKGYARHHPGTFLAGAAVLGVLAGRLTRNLAAESGTGSEKSEESGEPDAAGGLAGAVGSGSGYTGSATYVGAGGAAYPDPAYTEPAGAGSPYADPAYPDPAGAGASPTDVVATDPEHGGTVYTTGATSVTPPAGAVAAPLGDATPAPVPTRPVPPSEPTHRVDPNGEARP